LLKIRQGVEENPGDDAEEDGGDDSLSGDPSLQTRLPALDLLLLALDGTLNKGKNGGLGLHSGSDRFVERPSIFCSPAGNEVFFYFFFKKKTIKTKEAKFVFLLEIYRNGKFAGEMRLGLSRAGAIG